MNDIKSDIKSILKRHRGRKNPISRRDLLQSLNGHHTQDRRLRQLINEIRKEGLPILFTTSKPYGYYLPDNFQELQECKRKLQSYIIDLCVIYTVLNTYGERYLNEEYQEHLL